MVLNVAHIGVAHFNCHGKEVNGSGVQMIAPVWVIGFLALDDPTHHMHSSFSSPDIILRAWAILSSLLSSKINSVSWYSLNAKYAAMLKAPSLFGSLIIISAACAAVRNLLHEPRVFFVGDLIV